MYISIVIKVDNKSQVNASTFYFLVYKSSFIYIFFYKFTLRPYIYTWNFYLVELHNDWFFVLVCLNIISLSHPPHPFSQTLFLSSFHPTPLTCSLPPHYPALYLPISYLPAFFPLFLSTSFSPLSSPSQLSSPLHLFLRTSPLFLHLLLPASTPSHLSLSLLPLQLLQTENLDLKLTPYKVLATSTKHGYVPTIANRFRVIYVYSTHADDMGVNRLHSIIIVPSSPIAHSLQQRPSTLV